MKINEAVIEKFVNSLGDDIYDLFFAFEKGIEEMFVNAEEKPRLEMGFDPLQFRIYMRGRELGSKMRVKVLEMKENGRSETGN